MGGKKVGEVRAATSMEEVVRNWGRKSTNNLGSMSVGLREHRQTRGKEAKDYEIVPGYQSMSFQEEGC